MKDTPSELVDELIRKKLAWTENFMLTDLEAQELQDALMMREEVSERKQGAQPVVDAEEHAKPRVLPDAVKRVGQRADEMARKRGEIV